MSFLSPSAQQRAESRRRKSVRRVAKACDWCRSKKDRCDGARPTCATCEAAERCCTYNMETKKRGLPEGYVRTLERLWGLATRLVPEIEDALLDMITEESSASRPGDISRLWNSDSDQDSFFSSWRKGRLYNELHRQLTSTDGLLFDDFSSQARIECYDTEKIRSCRAQTAKLAAQSSKRLNATRDIGFIAPDKNVEKTPTASRFASPSRLMQQTREETISGRTGNTESDIPLARRTQLLQHYMKNTNTWLPMIDQADFMRLLYRYNQGQALERDEHALFKAMIAYSAFQTSGSSDQSNDGVVRLESMHEDACKTLLQGRKQTPGCIRYVKALVVMTLVSIGQGNWEEAWSMIGRAIRLATYLKLPNQRSTKSREPTYTHERGNHTFLACFILETLLSSYLGLPTHLRPENLAGVGQIDCTGMDEWEPWTGDSKSSPGTSPPQVPAFSASTFNNLTEVAKLLQAAYGLPTARGDPLELWKNLLNQFKERKKMIQESTERMMAGLLPHHIFLLVVVEAGLSQLYRHGLTEGLASQTELMEELSMIGERTLKLFKDQSSRFEVGAFQSGYLPLLGLLFDKLEPSSRMQELARETAKVLRPVSAVWPGFKHFEKQHGSQGEDNNEQTIVQERSAKAPLTRHVPGVASIKNTPALDEPEMYAWPDKTLPSEYANVMPSAMNVAPVEIAATMEDSSASSLGDMDMDTAFHEMMAADADAWSQSWSQSLLNLGFCTGETMDEVSRNMFIDTHDP